MRFKSSAPASAEANQNFITLDVIGSFETGSERPALELAPSKSTRQTGSLSLAAVAHVFTISYVAEMLGEDEDWLRELSSDMFPAMDA
jgi:hypothetical protein